MGKYRNETTTGSAKVSKALMGSLGMALTLVISCSNDSNSQSPSSEIVPTNEELNAGSAPPKSIYNINAYPLNKLVCDPFDNTPAPSPKHGIKSSLSFRTPDQPTYGSVIDYILNYRKSEQSLFFNSINVPTRMFSAGFPLESGGMIRNDQGSEIVEYFALKFESQITLGENDEEGTYELALLSDDGAILKINDPLPYGATPAGWQTLVNNDGNTPTRMRCASRLVDMKRDSKLPIELLYYQGPRFHIANMVIWRRASIPGQDSLCGQAGNNLFFDPNNGSVPVKWNDLQSRGWKVLNAKNYLLPDSPVAIGEGEVSYNACYQGQIPAIAEFQVIEELSGEIFFSWKTDIPAVSQIMITNLDTGEKNVTYTDNVLRTTHQIRVRNLQSGTNYRFQVIAISADLGRGISTAIQLKAF